MTNEPPRVVRLHAALLGVLAFAYVGWAARFIARSAVETSDGRYFCLFDDAMVSMRYAWNLAHGDGLVWNPGERVEGITSFSFTLVMTLGALVLDKSNAVLFVQLTGVVLVLVVALFAHALSRSLGAPRLLALLSALAVLGYYPLSYWSLMGMETGLLAALSGAALCLAMKLGSEPQGSKLLGLLLGLMFATRPDAAMPGLVILGFRAVGILLRERRPSALVPWLRELAVFFGIVLGLTLFRLCYYGSPVPNTYDLKVARWPLLLRLENGYRFVGPFFETSRTLLLFALVSVVLERDRRRLLLVCFAAAVIACQIWVGGDAWRYWRMLVPGVVALVVLAVDGACQLILRLAKTSRESLVVAFSLPCTAWWLWEANQPFVDELRLRTPAFYVPLNQTGVKASFEIARHVDPRGSIAVMAAGTVPYYSGLRGVDVLGKSDRTIARMPTVYVAGRNVVPGHKKYDLYYSIQKLRPDVIYDALRWSRYQPGIFEFVTKNYVQRGSFSLWYRRDSPHVHWERFPP